MSLSESSVVGIATRGRPAILQETLIELRAQTEKPAKILVAFTQASDIGDLPELFPEVTFLKSTSGLTSQRNAILACISEFEIVTFFDDDFLPAANYLAVVNEVLRTNPTVVVATGGVLADGINGPGLDLVEARAILARAPRFSGSPTLEPVFNAYGCNMTLRSTVLRENDLHFDQKLPLYGWYEDVDLSRQLARFGRVVKVEQACGVHLGVKSGRQSGIRLGYSQVANPVYLALKGSVSWAYALASLSSRTAKNLVFSVRPEVLIDRRGRLKGNGLALLDLLRGKLHPTRILDF